MDRDIPAFNKLVMNKIHQKNMENHYRNLINIRVPLFLWRNRKSRNAVHWALVQERSTPSVLNLKNKNRLKLIREMYFFCRKWVELWRDKNHLHHPFIFLKLSHTSLLIRIIGSTLKIKVFFVLFKNFYRGWLI